MILIKCSRSVFCHFSKGHYVNKSGIVFSKVRFCSTNEKDNFQEVYYGTLTPQIRGVKMFSLTTSAAGLLAQPVLYKSIASYGGGLPLTLALGSVVGFFTFVTPFLLHFITKKYVTRIHYSEKHDVYRVTLLSFFLRSRQITFKPEDVKVPDILGPFTSFTINGEPVFVDGRLFADQQHYIRIMGYDKPMDFKLGNKEEPSKKQTST